MQPDLAGNLEQDGEYYTQRLDFYENRTGTDIIQIEHRNGYVTEDRYNFEWRWDNSAQTCIRMVYGPSDISYFENIWLAGNFLKGTLDGVNVNFTGISKKKKADDTQHISSRSPFPNTLLNFNTLYRILISNTPSSNNDTHHYQSDNHQMLFRQNTTHSYLSFRQIDPTKPFL